MEQTQTLFDTHLPPLAERLRPTSIDDYKGQSHLVGNGKILRTIIEEEKIFSMIPVSYTHLTLPTTPYV